MRPNSRSRSLGRLALRADKQATQKANLDPEIAREASRDASARADEANADVAEKLRRLGVTVEGDKFDVGAMANRAAKNVIAKQVGENNRIHDATNILERGPFLERTLDIDPQRVWSNGKKLVDFQETNLNKLLTTYLNTVGPDIEVFRTFGQLDPTAPGTEFSTRLAAQVDEQVEAARATLTGKKLAREEARVHRRAEVGRKEVHALVQRARNLRGTSTDPTSIANRAGRSIINVQALSKMGHVVAASVPDVARPLLVQGLKRSFGSLYDTHIRGMKDAKRARREQLNYVGAEIDIHISERTKLMADVMDQNAPGTLVERGLQYSANHLGRAQRPRLLELHRQARGGHAYHDSHHVRHRDCHDGQG